MRPAGRARRSLYPKYSGGRPKTFTLPERREIKKVAKSKPAEHDLPFSTWSPAKPADFLVAEGVVDDISREGLRLLLREEGVSFQRLRTWKTAMTSTSTPVSAGGNCRSLRRRGTTGAGPCPSRSEAPPLRGPRRAEMRTLCEDGRTVGAVSDDPRIRTPGTFEFPAPYGVLRIAWIGEGPEAVEQTRAKPVRVEEADGTYPVTKIRRRIRSRLEIVPRFPEGR